MRWPRRRYGGGELDIPLISGGEGHPHPQPLHGGAVVGKLLAEVGGLPVLVRCVEAFQQAPSIAEVVVVTREELVPEIPLLRKKEPFGSPPLSAQWLSTISMFSSTVL